MRYSPPVDLFVVAFRPGNESVKFELIRWPEMLIEQLNECYKDEFAHTSAHRPLTSRRHLRDGRPASGCQQHMVRSQHDLFILHSMGWLEGVNKELCLKIRSFSREKIEVHISPSKLHAQMPRLASRIDQ